MVLIVEVHRGRRDVEPACCRRLRDIDDLLRDDETASTRYAARLGRRAVLERRRTLSAGRTQRYPRLLHRGRPRTIARRVHRDGAAAARGRQFRSVIRYRNLALAARRSDETRAPGSARADCDRDSREDDVMKKVMRKTTGQKVIECHSLAGGAGTRGCNRTDVMSIGSQARGYA